MHARRLLKPIANRLGITTATPIWKNLALKRYKYKIRTNPSYRRWVEQIAPDWIARHWAHHVEQDAFSLAHLTSQLYELTEIMRRRYAHAPSALILDAGASDGFFLQRLGAARGVGMNLLKPCVDTIKSDGFAACQADLENLPFADDTFDLIMCFETLEHLPNPIHGLTELVRVCRKKICVSIPWVPHTRIYAKARSWPAVDQHVFEFDEEDFDKVLSFIPAKVSYRTLVDVFPEPRNPVLRVWFSLFMYPAYFPKLQYCELDVRP